MLLPRRRPAPSREAVHSPTALRHPSSTTRHPDAGGVTSLLTTWPDPARRARGHPLESV